MINLKEYIRESIGDNVDETLKNSITKWIKSNTKSIKENRLDFDFNTNPVTVNYDGDIMFKPNITSLVNSFQWGEVSGDFNCEHCENLTSLEGSPEKVGGIFTCAHCISLTTLEGAPKEVEGEGFYCFYCTSLTSLEGAPKEIEGSFDCHDCTSLKTLEGAPEKVGGYFSCNYCTRLESLKGAPKKSWNFYANGCGRRFL